MELPDLDPGGKNAIEFLNSFFVEEVVDFDELDRNDLIWYLRTLIVNYKLLLEHARKLERRVK